jgi:hypothetical protein
MPKKFGSLSPRSILAHATQKPTTNAYINNANARKKCGATKSISNSVFYRKL